MNDSVNNINAYQIADDQLTPEQLKKRKECEAYLKREREYSNSYENCEKEGYGYIKTRMPDEKTDFSNLKLDKYDWDFQIKGAEYDVYYIRGYQHTTDNCLYFCPKGETPSYSNLKPFDKDWSPVEWSFEIKEIKSWKYKWDEIRTNSGWIGYLCRNGSLFHVIRSSDCNYVWNALQISLLKAQECPLNFTDRNWKEKAIGRKIWYHEKPCIIEYINNYEEIRLKIIGDNPEKRIEAPATWTDDSEICSKKHWDESYADGMYIEWDSPHINWYRN